ncbi:MAG: O-antigen ligase family protein, partial [Endomicrobiales bacterium]
ALGGEKMFETTPINKLIFITMAFTFFSLWQGAHTLGEPFTFSASNVRAQTWKNYMLLPLLYLITVNNIRSVRQMKWLLVIMFLALVPMDFYTARQIHFTPGLASRDKLVGTFVFLGPNQLAAFYVQTLLLLLGIFIVHRDRIYRLAAAGLMGAGLFITLFLYSRGAYIALLAGLLAISLIKKRILILPLLAVLFTWEAVLPATVVDRIKETQTAQGQLDTSSQHRLDLWKESLKLFASSPLTGIGFDVIYQQGLIGTFKDTHNIYVKVLAEQGIMGIVLFMLLLLSALKSGFQLYVSDTDTFLKGLGLGFTSSVIATMTANVFGDRWTFLQVSAYFWVCLALVVRGLLLVQRGEVETS